MDMFSSAPLFSVSFEDFFLISTAAGRIMPGIINPGNVSSQPMSADFPRLILVYTL